jgi:hypothetical protein
MSLLETARDWTLFREVLGQSCDLTEKEFKRLTVPARLERLVAAVGMEPLVAEINATLGRLKVGYNNGDEGLSCDIQRHGGVSLGWCPYAYEDPTFLPMNPYRFLPALIRLEERLKAERGSWDVHRQVRRLCTRTR